MTQSILRNTTFALAFSTLMTIALGAEARTASGTAAAKTLTYEVDYANSGDLEESILTDLCGIPSKLTINANEDLATAVLKKTQGSDPKKLKIVKIQDVKGSISGGDLVEPYVGDYHTQVFIVHQPGWEGSYKEGIYNRVEINSYGDSKAPKAFRLESELLNYRESAEIAEGAACPLVSFKLVK